MIFDKYGYIKIANSNKLMVKIESHNDLPMSYINIIFDDSTPWGGRAQLMNEIEQLFHKNYPIEPIQILGVGYGITLDTNQLKPSHRMIATAWEEELTMRNEGAN